MDFKNINLQVNYYYKYNIISSCIKILFKTSKLQMWKQIDMDLCDSSIQTIGPISYFVFGSEE